MSLSHNTKLHQFLQQDSGAYAILSAITISLLIGIVGFVLTTSFATLNKVRNQSSTDLAVVSASAACIGALKQGVEFITAQSTGLTSGQAVFEQNVFSTNTPNNVQNSNVTNPIDCNYQITYSSSTDVFLNPFPTAAKNITNNTLSASNTNVTAAASAAQSLEVVFAFDDSYSMRLKLQNGGQIAADALSTAVAASYDTLFDGIAQPTKERFAASQLGYSKNVSFELESNETGTAAGFTNDKDVLKNNFSTKYKGGDDSTNIFAGLTLGIDKLSIGSPKIQEDDHNEVLVLMSDGVPNITTAGETVIIQPPTKSYNNWICDGTLRERPTGTKEVPVYKDDILIGYNTVKTGGGKYCDGTERFEKVTYPNPDAGKEIIQQQFDKINDSAKLLAERDRIIATCNDFVKASTANSNRLIFSVFFETDNSNIAVGKEIMEGCASSPDTFYYARNQQELSAAYQQIAAKLLNISPIYAPVTLVQ